MTMEERQSRAAEYARECGPQYRATELDRYGEAKIINYHSRSPLAGIRVRQDGAVEEWGILPPLPKKPVEGKLQRGWNPVRGWGPVE